jgi:hypothetical protein
MTISTTSNKAIWQGNGSTTVWPFNFEIGNVSQITLTLTSGGSVTTIPSSSFSVSGLGLPNGGTITYPLSGSPIAQGTTLTLVRTVPLQQLTDLQNQSNYFPDAVEGALDYEMLAIQQLAQQIANSLQTPSSDPTLNLTFPPAPARALTLVGFDANGNVATYPITASVGAGNLTAELGSNGKPGFKAGTDFTAGVTTTLNLSKAYGNVANVFVAFDGAYQEKDSYTISGTQIVFNAAIPVGVQNVDVVGGTTLSIYTPAAGTVGDAQLSWGNVLGRMCSSLSEMAALNPAIYTRAFATGYYLPGDAGGGGYYYSASTSQSLANGGTIIASTYGGATGCWLLAQTHVVSLGQFGAKTDGTDASTQIMNAFAWAKASNLTLDVTGNFSVTKVTLSGANGMALQGRGSLVGIATSATDCVLELINSSDVTINGRLVINAAYNTNYSYGVHAYTTGSSQTVAYLDFANMPVVAAKVGYAFGNTARPDDQVSEINMRGGYTYGCPVALQAMGVQTVVNVQGANLISGYGSGNAGWQALTQKTVIAIGATVNITGGELLHPAVSTGSLVEIQPLVSVSQGIVLYGNISVCNAVLEPACPLATTLNTSGNGSPQQGCIQFIGCNCVHTQNAFAFVQTDNTFIGRLIFHGNYFHATVARTFANISCGGSCDVYCDDVSFGPNFVQGLSGITGGIVHFSHRRILEVNTTASQPFTSGALTVVKYTGVLNNADTTGRFSNGYNTSTGQFTAPQALKDVEVHAAVYFATLTANAVTVDVYVNGAQKMRYVTTTYQWFGGGFIEIGDLNSGDTVDIRVTQTSGGTVTEGGGALSKMTIKARY